MSNKKSRDFTEVMKYLCFFNTIDEATEWVQRDLFSTKEFTEEGLKDWAEKSGYIYKEEE